MPFIHINDMIWTTPMGKSQLILLDRQPITVLIMKVSKWRVISKHRVAEEEQGVMMNQLGMVAVLVGGVCYIINDGIRKIIDECFFKNCQN